MAGTAIAGIGVAASIGSTVSSMVSSGDAADAQRDAAQTASDTQMAMYNQNRTDMMPWLIAGTTAIDRLNRGTAKGGEYDKFTLANFQADPGYAWRKQQGVDAIRAGSAAAGTFGSGNMGVALQNYGQNLASEEYSKAYGRWVDAYNRVAGIAGTGQQQSQALASTGTGVANSIANNTMLSGYAQAQGIMNQGNALSSGITGLGRQTMYGLGSYYGQQQNTNLLNSLGYNSGYSGYSGNLGTAAMSDMAGYAYGGYGWG